MGSKVLRHSRLYFHPQSRAQRGMALAMLLWLVAAMSLLVAGVVFLARADVKQVQFAAEKARMTALADGALNVGLRKMKLLSESFDYSGAAALNMEVTVAGQPAELLFTPFGGLFNVNNSNFELLRDLFKYGADVELEEAEALAENLLNWRRPIGPNNISRDDEYLAAGLPAPRHNKFRVIEEFAAVLGVTGEIYLRLKEIVYVDPTVSDGINPRSAPPAALKVLASGNQRIVDEYIELRNENPLVRPHAEMKRAYIGRGNSTGYRVDVNIPAPGGKVYRRRVWVLDKSSDYGTPWVVQRVEPTILLASRSDKKGELEEASSN